MSYEEFLRTPEGHGYNLVDGMLLHEPSASRRHEALRVRLIFALEGHVRERGLGRIFAELDVHLEPTQVYEPDVYFVSRDRRPHLQERGLMGVSPDLAVEILSPYSRRYDRGAKRRIYGKHGCREYWLVDPWAETVEVFRPEAGGELVPAGTFGRAGSFASSVITGFTLSVDELFADLD